MIARHATFRKNLASIRQWGIQTRYSKGRMAAVWFHAAEKTAWACGHAVLRHGGRIEDVVVLVVDLPEGSFRRLGNPKGVYYCLEDVVPERIRATIEFQEVYASEVKDDGNGKGSDG